MGKYLLGFVAMLLVIFASFNLVACNETCADDLVDGDLSDGDSDAENEAEADGDDEVQVDGDIEAENEAEITVDGDEVNPGDYDGTCYNCDSVCSGATGDDIAECEEECEFCQGYSDCFYWLDGRFEGMSEMSDWKSADCD